MMDKNGLSLARFTNILLFSMFVGALAVGALALFYNFSYDDSYIYYRYADNLAAGHGFVFNVGDPLEGYSSFLWLLILGLAKIVTGANTIMLAKVLGMGFFVGTLVLLYLAICREAARENGRREIGALVSILLVFFVFLVPSAPLWSLGGLENGVWSFVLIVYIICVARWYVLGSAIAVCVLSITRVESVAFAALPIALGIVEAYWNRKSEGGFIFALRRHFLEDRRLFYTVFFTSLLVFVSAVTLFRLAYFHQPLPATYYFKRPAGLFTSVPKGIAYLQTFALGNPTLAVAFGLSLAMPWVWIKNRLFLAATLVVAAQLLFVLWVGGDWMVFHRFLAAFIPLMVLNVGGAILWAISRGRVLGSAAILISVLLLFATVPSTYSIFKSEAKTGGMYQVLSANRNLGKFLNLHSSPDALIAVGDVGAIPYYAKRRIIDLHGLMDHHLLKYVGDFTNSEHENIDADYVLSRKPAWIVLIGNKPFREKNRTIPAYLLYRKLYDNPSFKENYAFYSEYKLAYYYFYQLFYDKRQVGHYKIDIDLKVDGPGKSRAEFYVNQQFSESIQREFPNFKRSTVSLDSIQSRLTHLRFDPTATENSRITIYGIKLVLDDRVIEISPAQISRLVRYNLEIETVTDDKVVFRAKGSDPVLVLDSLFRDQISPAPKG